MKSRGCYIKSKNTTLSQTKKMSRWNMCFMWKFKRSVYWIMIVLDACFTVMKSKTVGWKARRDNIHLLNDIIDEIMLLWTAVSGIKWRHEQSLFFLMITKCMSSKSPCSAKVNTAGLKTMTKLQPVVRALQLLALEFIVPQRYTNI